MDDRVSLEGKQDSRAVALQLADHPNGTVDPVSLTPMAHANIVFWLSTLGHKDLALRRARQFAQTFQHFARVMVFDVPLRSLGCEPDFQALARELKVEEARVQVLWLAGK